MSRFQKIFLPIFFCIHVILHCIMFSHFPFYFTFSPTPILLIPPVKYLSTSCPILSTQFSVRYYGYPISVLPTLYYILYISCSFLSISLNICPLFYLHPLSILFLYPSLFHFYFLDCYPIVLTRYKKNYLTHIRHNMWWFRKYSKIYKFFLYFSKVVYFWFS